MRLHLRHSGPDAARVRTVVRDVELRRGIELRSQLPLIGDGADVVWVEIAHEGKWLGHPSGAFEFDRGVFEALCKNFERQKNALPFTYEHPDHQGETPAAGWVHELEVRDCTEHGCELWARVEFTKRAAQMIRDGEYRFCSVVVDFEAIDRASAEEVGPELFEVGLTNTPFLDGQHPIKFSRARDRRGAVRKLQRGQLMDLQDVIKAVMSVLPDDATPETFMRVFEAEIAKRKAVEGAGGEEPAPEADAAQASDAPDERTEAADTPTGDVQATEAPGADPEPADTVQLEMDEATTQMALQALEGLAAELGTDLAGVVASLQERLPEVAALLGGAPASGTPAEEAVASKVDEAKQRALSKRLDTANATITKLSKEVDELKWERTKSRVEQAIADGQLLEEDRDEMLELAQEAPKVFEKKLAKAAEKPAVPKGSVYRAAPAEYRDNVSEDEAEAFRRKHYSQLPKKKGRELAVLALKRLQDKEHAQA